MQSTSHVLISYCVMRLHTVVAIVILNGTNLTGISCFLQLNETGHKLLFRDKRLKVHVYILCHWGEGAFKCYVTIFF